MSDIQSEKTKFTFEELKQKYVDYTDSTANEPRIGEDGKIDQKIFYPIGHTYINPYRKNELFQIPTCIVLPNSLYEEDKFVKRLNDSRIQYAIKYLQISALKKFIIKNYSSVLFTNPFYMLYFTYFPVDKNVEAVKEIIQILIENYDDYYNLIMRTIQIPEKNKEFICELLTSFLPNDEDNLCSICLHTEPKYQLVNICKCKTSTHTKCLIRLNEHKRLTNCRVCLGKYKINTPIYRVIELGTSPIIDSTLYFPHSDFYFQPLMSDNNLHQIKGIDRLKFAIWYLQVDRVKELLKEEDIKKELLNIDMGYGQTPLHQICTGNFYTNAHITYGDNVTKYIYILDLLLMTNKIDYERKDKFGKTYREYLEKIDREDIKNAINGIIILNRRRECFEHIRDNWTEEKYKNCLSEWKEVIKKFIVINKENILEYSCECGGVWSDKNLISKIYNVCPACDTYIQPYLCNPKNIPYVKMYIPQKYHCMLISIECVNSEPETDKTFMIEMPAI